MGLGMLNFCGEVDAWFELQQSFDPKSTNAVFVGDTVFGFQWDIDIGCIEEALQTVCIFGIRELGLSNVISPKARGLLLLSACRMKWQPSLIERQRMSI